MSAQASPNWTVRAAAFIRGAAAAGVALLSFQLATSLVFGGWCWPWVLYGVLFFTGYAALLVQRRWESVIAGACCWAVLVLVWGCKPNEAIDEASIEAILLLALGVVLTANAWTAGRRLWLLPVPKGRLVCGVCLALLETALLIKPYWLAKYHGKQTDLRGTVLVFGDLRRAHLVNADLRHANLHGACLEGADLTGSNLTGANLTDACLDGANLTHADLTGAKLTWARFSPSTRWPAGFSPWSHGARLRTWL